MSIYNWNVRNDSIPVEPKFTADEAVKLVYQKLDLILTPSNLAHNQLLKDLLTTEGLRKNQLFFPHLDKDQFLTRLTKFLQQHLSFQLMVKVMSGLKAVELDPMEYDEDSSDSTSGTYSNQLESVFMRKDSSTYYTRKRAVLCFGDCTEVKIFKNGQVQKAFKIPVSKCLSLHQEMLRVHSDLVAKFGGVKNLHLVNQIVKKRKVVK
jgi:hypothetical protein